MDANVNGLRRLLDFALAESGAGRPLKGFLYFSSSEIYGDPSPDQIPTREDYPGLVSSIGPRACYDESKRYGETLCVNFARVHGIPISMVRPFNNYGPGLNLKDGRVIPDFASNILAGEDIQLLSDGSPTRTFCYVADAVVGYLLAMLKGVPGEPYNIGTEKPEISMRSLAEKMIAIARTDLGYQGQLRLATSEDQQYLTDNPNRRCPDLTKSNRDLGYLPEVDLDEGLRRTLVWYRQQLDGGVG
jgi:dTDP-glucose 4,6-dehydratase/UDP-glucuronate decarboxylase